MLAHTRLALVLVAITALSACDCRPVLVKTGKTVVTIDSPDAGSAYTNGQTFTFHATASNEIGLASLELEAGGSGGITSKQLKLCEATSASWGITTSEADGATEEGATCEFSFQIDQNLDLISSGTILLTAKATDRKNGVKEATVTVDVKPLTCRFVDPPISAGTNPPVANVGGTTDLSVQISNEAIAMKSVIVTSDNGKTPASWTANFPSNGLLAKNIAWGSVLGYGAHKLTATCTDIDGNVDSDLRTVNVGCGSDSDCVSGDGCCSGDGKCYPMVAEGALCDCQHPCPANEGCFPGICNATPQKCRPGCFPGADTPPPYGTAPASCASQDGLLSFCNFLPASEVTTQNQGGACAVGDNCDVITQNCPDLAVDRSQPVSNSNPKTHYNCVPFAPGVNGCVPAGPIPVDGTNCNQVCGQTAGNCVKGAWCTQLLDSSGNPLGPPTCSLQCSTPTQNPMDSTGCKSGEYCDAVFGLGQVYFSTGACQSSTG